MTADLLPMELPTLPGCVHGIIAIDNSDPNRHVMTVQCSGCYATRTDRPILAAGFALFPHGAHDGERLCADCRKACGCEPCRRTL